MVDMSATIIHHGHIRLLKKASEYGKVIVGLTTDDELLNKKGYQPELDFESRKEVLESIKYVDEVVAVPWALNDATLDKHSIDFFVHGDDNSNDIKKEKLLIFPRTEGVCSRDIRKKSSIISNKVKRNILLNPGPATTTDTVKMAQVVPDICPREHEFGDLMEYVSTELTKIVASPKKYTTVLFGGSGTAVVESTISSVVPHDKTILIVNNGAYGKKYYQYAGNIFKHRVAAKGKNNHARQYQAKFNTKTHFNSKHAAHDRRCRDGHSGNGEGIFKELHQEK